MCLFSQAFSSSYLLSPCCLSIDYGKLWDESFFSKARVGPSAVEDSDTQQSTLPMKTRDSGHMIALRQKASRAVNQGLHFGVDDYNKYISGELYRTQFLY